MRINISPHRMELRRSKILFATVCFILLLEIGTIDARQNEKRRKDKSTTSERPHTTNICDISDRDSKVHCYCEETQAIRNVSKAECWVFNGGIPIDDPIWDAFQSQNRLQELSFNVRADGGLSFVPTRALRSMRRVKKITIKYGNIDEIYSFAFANLTSIKEILLTRNKIVRLEANAIAHLPNLTTLTLDENRIGEIGKNSFVDLPVLQTLYLTSNNISIIQDGAFKQLVQLLELELDKNSIALLNKATFDGLANLKRLDLRNNRIKMLNDFTFAELWTLQELLLDGNELKLISERAFDGLSQLKTLSLSENRLTVLTSGLFEGVRGLTHLDLRQNRLQTLTIDDIRPILDNLKSASSQLLLDDNNLSCDCRLTWIHALRNDTKNEKTKSSLEQITCILESPEVSHDDFLDNSLERTKPNKGYSHNSDNRLREKGKHKVLSQKSTVEYIDVPEDFKDNLDEEAYDEHNKDKDGLSQQNKGQNDTNSKKGSKKHLFQIPVETLPCSEELKDSTEAPLSRPSRGEVKDFRGLSSGSPLQSASLFLIQMAIVVSCQVFY